MILCFYKRLIVYISLKNPLSSFVMVVVLIVFIQTVFARLLGF
jgi:hypothetical protein